MSLAGGRGRANEKDRYATPISLDELAMNRHPARGQFPAVIELQVREARRVR
jgi:hypothetical protein